MHMVFVDLEKIYYRIKYYVEGLEKKQESSIYISDEEHVHENG